MKKNFVIDTNVLIHNPSCILKFEDNDVYILYPVLEELDKFKNESSERGYSARTAIRNLKEYRNPKYVGDGYKLPGGGKLYMCNYQIDWNDLPEGWDRDKKDNLILLMTKTLRKVEKDTILVTNDANMMLKADALRIPVQEYRNDRLAPDQELYSGRSVRIVSPETVSMFYENGLDDFEDSDAFINLTENEFVTLTDRQQASALCKYQDGKLLRLYNTIKCPRPYGIEPRNAAQHFLMEALLSPADVHPLTIANGPAGTGKTLLALACGLEQVTEQHLYKRVLVCRANVTMEDLGYLPGSERDKIDPLLRGVYDNLSVMLEKEDDTPEMARSKYQYLFDHGDLTTESIAYLRGRSICNTYIIIDEAQNCTPNQILSIVTRVGTGSKLVLLGDINQIDSPRLDYGNNGLTYAIERMKGSPLCEICSFLESESTRSPLAKEAAERLAKNNR